jgi:hypothetical protein
MDDAALHASGCRGRTATSTRAECLIIIQSLKNIVDRDEDYIVQ